MLNTHSETRITIYVVFGGPNSFLQAMLTALFDTLGNYIVLCLLFGVRLPSRQRHQLRSLLGFFRRPSHELGICR